VFPEEHVIYRYKYLPFNEYSLKAISEGTIKFTCPLEFNDPFDCRPFFDTTQIDQIHKLRPDLYKEAMDRRGLSPGQRILKRNEFVTRLRNRIEDGSFAEDLLRKVGVVSLTRDPLSILMWSHYADRHKGFALELRIPTCGSSRDASLALHRLLPLAVHYSKTMTTVALGPTHDYEVVKKMVLTKGEGWKYEAEERVVDHERPPGVYPYRRDDILCSVIAGMGMCREHYQTLEKVVANVSVHSLPNLRLYRATAVPAEYRVEVSDHPRLSRTSTST
jgi:hypothetical protein